MIASSAASAPMMRPAFARTSSAASGLRFCGMIEEPVVNLSESASNPTSGEVKITISSARRDDAGVNVLQRALEGKLAALDLRADRVQALRDLAGILAGEDALLRQHFGVGLGRGNVLGVEGAVDPDRRVDLFHDGVGLRAEPAAPHLVAHGSSIYRLCR